MQEAKSSRQAAFEILSFLFFASKRRSISKIEQEKVIRELKYRSPVANADTAVVTMPKIRILNR